MSNSEKLEQWIGKSIENSENINEFPVKAMSAVFNYDNANIKEVPYGWHWLYFLNLPLQKNHNTLKNYGFKVRLFISVNCTTGY